MSIQLVSGFVALISCLGTLPLVRRFAQRFSLYDEQGPLKIHSGYIPRLGGIAMFVGFLAGTLTHYVFGVRLSYLPLFMFIPVWVVGLIDDVWSLGAGFRLFIHISAGSALWLAGWRLMWFTSAPLDLFVTSVFVAFMINAWNLLDGMDGLASGTATIVSIGFLMISSVEANGIGMLVAACLLGACLGMFSFNTPPAKMFMGDSGSTLIGIALAFLSLNWVKTTSDPHSIAIPLLFFSIPLADACLAILRRSRTPRLLFDGDRRHFYDLLLQRGLSVETVLNISMGVSALLVLLGWMCVHQIIGLRATCIAVALGLISSAILLGSLQPESKPLQPARQESPAGSAGE
ncbi:MAG TPA: MraY family glycosyltransferase [Candidatus Saccharimonadales bacterium]|jgi:UDP-GlcNAc:undecaprenyl-phosphate GlcNAc-1-phosphate transferase|nr:MraY family glycosyltransferase [Candidatus Saccharimonadales bacterium]